METMPQWETVLEPDSESEGRQLRAQIARCLFVLSCALFVFSLLTAIAIWYMARQDHKLITAEVREHWLSNQGPWHFYPGMKLLDDVTLTLLAGSAAAGVSFLLKPRWQTAVLLLISGWAFWEALDWWFFLGD